MKKIQYIQPKSEMVVMPEGALMDFPVSPGSGMNPGNAPQRITNPAAPRDSIGVWM